jgi:2-polyprenyl-3-methyl-5-hydroxy-6-metoxy-1,4-benzoquinol methylase
MRQVLCRVCDSSQLELAIDLGLQTWANHFLKPEEIGTEPFYPLHLVHCQACGTAQLDFTVPKEVMFSDHTYLSGITKSLNDHFARVAQDIDSRLRARVGPPSTTQPFQILDIGSNDGTFLKHFKHMGYDVLGVDSSRTTARMAQEAGIPTRHAFFNLELAKSMDPGFNVIHAAGVFFHLEEIHSVTKGIRHLLAPDGLFVIQFLYMKQIVRNLAFDQIYHEHLLYLNLANLDILLGRHGLKLFDAYLAPIHGGSIVAFVGHAPGPARTPHLETMLAAEEKEGSNKLETYRQFGKRIEQMKVENVAWLLERKKKGKRIFGLGAPVKGNTLLNYFRIGRDILDCLVERNPLRRGLYSPGMHIPILLEDELTGPPDVYYVLAWNFRDEILVRYRKEIDQGVEFYFPIRVQLD